MGNILTLYNYKLAEKSEANHIKTMDSYVIDLRNALEILYISNDFSGFVEAMQSAIERNLSDAWIAGAATCGIAESDISNAEVSQLLGLILRDFSFIAAFGANVVSGRTQGATIESFFPRLNIWANRWGETKAIAESMSCGDQKLRWQIGIAEHCEDCLRLNGKVKRASDWATAGIHPKMPTLACGGWNCKCTFVPTNEPLTAGQIAPSLSTTAVGGALIGAAAIAAIRTRPQPIQLASAINAGDESINLEIGHNLSFGQTITITEANNTYTGIVFAAGPNIIEVSPPVDSSFSINAIVTRG